MLTIDATFLTSAFIALLCRMAIIDIKITLAIIVVQTIIFVRAVYSAYAVMVAT